MAVSRPADMLGWWCKQPYCYRSIRPHWGELVTRFDGLTLEIVAEQLCVDCLTMSHGWSRNWRYGCWDQCLVYREQKQKWAMWAKKKKPSELQVGEDHPWASSGRDMKCRWHLSTRGGIEEFILSGEILGNRGLDRLTHKKNYKKKKKKLSYKTQRLSK